MKKKARNLYVDKRLVNDKMVLTHLWGTNRRDLCDT